jgi:hypothetical protein
MWDMLEGLYLVILYVISFFTKNIHFGSINKETNILLVVAKYLVIQKMVSFGALSILLTSSSNDGIMRSVAKCIFDQKRESAAKSKLKNLLS